MNVLIANFGNDSIGLIEYARCHNLTQVYVVSVATGWEHPDWAERVAHAKTWVEELGFSWVRLQARPDFSNLVQAQREFPSTKFQWCATYLKGDTLRAWLTEVDPLKEATILLARRRAQSPKFKDLPEFVMHHSEEFGDRRIWHPLYLDDEQSLQSLVQPTPFPWLAHRSLECDPCVNSDVLDLDRALASNAVKNRLHHLESLMQEAFLPDPPKKSSRFLFDMGCGSPYGCGL